MSTNNISSIGSADELIFTARLTPYRSLGPQGFKTLMVVVGLVCFTIGMFFSSLGLWPVIGFMGLDFLLIYWAFKANYASAKSYEDVEISRRHVLLQKTTPKGTTTRHEFPQFGTRFKVDRHDEIGITKMRITNRKREIEFGYFLNPADKESFALAFGRALARAKQ